VFFFGSFRGFFAASWRPGALPGVFGAAAARRARGIGFSDVKSVFLAAATVFCAARSRALPRAPPTPGPPGAPGRAGRVNKKTRAGWLPALSRGLRAPPLRRFVFRYI